MSEFVLSCRGLSKTFVQGSYRVSVLSEVNIQVKNAETLAIIGASGSGKSTLLHLLGGLDVPSQGEVEVLGRLMSKISEAEQGRLRNESLGFVYQFHHLLAEFTALENVAMPLLIRRMPEAEAWRIAAEMLARVGLQHRVTHTPGELSGGERQRAALARALVTKPACVLADEPTGNLDRATAQTMLALMMQLNRDLGTAFIVVTHDPEIAARMSRTLRLQDGVLLEDR